MKRILFLLFTFFWASYAVAQQIMGEWHNHISYSSMKQLAQTPDRVFALNNGTLLSVDKNYGSVDYYSKITGLNDTKISFIVYCDDIKALLVLYENANLDLMYDDGSLYNINDIKQKSLLSDKTVNHVFFKDKKAYLSCNFGIVVVDLVRKEISDTYYISETGGYDAVLSSAYFNGFFYAITKNRICFAQEGKLLVNYENWITDIGITQNGNKKLLVFNGSMWLLKTNGVLYQHNGEGWQPRTDMGSFKNMALSGNKFFLNTSDDQAVYYNSSMEKTVIGKYPFNDILYDNDNSDFWMAIGREVLKLNMATMESSTYGVNGPALENAWRFLFRGNKTFVLPGGHWEVDGRAGFLMTYENRVWDSYSPASMAVVPKNTSLVKSITPVDFTDMAFDPNDSSRFFISSYGCGLYEFRKDSFYHLYNADTDSILIRSAHSERYPQRSYYMYTNVDGVTFDRFGNVWFVNTNYPAPLRYLTPNGKLCKYDSYLLSKEEVYTTQNFFLSKENPNIKYLLILRSPSMLYVFDDNGTPTDSSDDKERLYKSFIDQDGEVVSSDFFLCMAQDMENTIWLGTTSGIVVLRNPTTMLSSNYKCERIKIARNDGSDEADYLLANERINDIAVDGCNRKWIATGASGVYLVSADGQETIHHFTEDNSPLPSNTVLSVAVHPQTGEVFLGTGQGIVSYQGDAAEPLERFGNVHAYPNPVRQTFNGMITIKGLMENTRVKIVDSSGFVVYDTVSKGSLATWNGKLANGKEASSGVYIVICTTNDSKVYARTKILIMR